MLPRLLPTRPLGVRRALPRVAPSPLSPPSSPSPDLYCPYETPRNPFSKWAAEGGGGGGEGIAVPVSAAAAATTPLPLRVHVATFNAAGQLPTPDELLPRDFCGFEGAGGGGLLEQQQQQREGGSPPSPPPPVRLPDVVFVCTQEAGTRGPVAWEACMLRSLRAHALAAAHEEQAETKAGPRRPPPTAATAAAASSYSLVARRTLRGAGMVLHAAAFASSAVRVMGVEHVGVPTGARLLPGCCVSGGGWRAGNKGAAALSLRVSRRPWPAVPLLALPAGEGQGSRRGWWWRRGGCDAVVAVGAATTSGGMAAAAATTRLVFVGCHLAAHEGRAARRNEDAMAVSHAVGRAFGVAFGAGEEEEGEGEADALLPPALPHVVSCCSCLPFLPRWRRRHGNSSSSPRVAPWPRADEDSTVVVWAGDLNYRADRGEVAAALLAEEEEEEARRSLKGGGSDGAGEPDAAANALRWASVAKSADELTRERGPFGRCIALRSYREAPLAFPPTFKLETQEKRRRRRLEEQERPRAGRWRFRRVTADGSPDNARARLIPPRARSALCRYNRMRAPSWTDRVLWREVAGGGGSGKAPAAAPASEAAAASAPQPPPPLCTQLYYGPVTSSGLDNQEESSSVLERSDHRAVVAGFEVALRRH